MPISLTTINTDEVLRYMGTPPDQAGADLRALAETCAQEVISAARPRWAYRVFDLTPQAEGVRLDCGLLLPGEDLKRHLKDCRRAALFCATLSAQVDALIRRAESGDMLRALALDCCAAAAVEEVCDQIADLMAAGVDGIHLYTMNNPAVAKQISESIASIRSV